MGRLRLGEALGGGTTVRVDRATSGSELAFTVLPPASLAPVESPVAAGLETSPN